MNMQSDNDVLNAKLFESILVQHYYFALKRSIPLPDNLSYGQFNESMNG